MKIITLILATFVCAVQSALSQNYVKTVTYLDNTGTQKVTDIQYYDGIGRPDLSATNKLNTTGKYVYTLQTYDLDGRAAESWLPAYGSATPSYMTASQFSTISKSTYNNDSYAYRVNAYDALGRITAVDVEGAVWRNGNIQLRRRYGTNTGSDVKRYTTPVDGGYTLVKNGYYPAGSLTMEETEDEDGVKTQVYTDMRGLVVLERSVGTSETLDTYYVYNDLGQLRYVLTPGYQDDQHKAEQGYEYRYDAKGRVIKKILPGCDAIQYWYDKNNRLIGVKDPNLAEQGKCRFMLYDNYGRLVVEGTCDNLNYNHSKFTVSMLSGGSEFMGTGYRHSEQSIFSHPIVQKVFYYDNYSFLSAGKVTASGIQQQLALSHPVSAIGRQTGCIIRTSDGEDLFNATYYDMKGRPVDVRQSHVGGRLVATTTSYTFTDKPETIITTLTDGSTQVVLTEKNVYSTASDQLIATTQKWGNGTVKTVAQYSYDNLGRVSTCTRGGNSGTVSYGYNLRGWTESITGKGLTEILHYTDGTGTPRYNGSISSMTWQTGNESLVRGYRFDYDKFNRITNAVYGEGTAISLNTGRYSEQITGYDKNGNILGLKRYGKMNSGSFDLIDDLVLSYDGNRLVEVSDGAGNLSYANAFDFKNNTVSVTGTEYAYYDDGALRWDANKGISQIDYDLYGKPVRIQFSNGSVTENVYAADGTRLLRRHYTAMPNVGVNLGGRFSLTQANTLNYSNPPTTEYVGNFVFENGTLSKYLFAGGYCSFFGIASQPVYHYFAQDHLGNNRAVINESGTVEQTTHYYAFGGVYGDAGYNPGLQGYKYNGKELDNVQGLGWYDYGARQYDPALGRFTSMDPLAEKYYAMNPYAYCHNNSINLRDPNGMDDYYSFAGDFLYRDDNDTDNIYIRFESFNITTWNSDLKRFEDAMRYIDIPIGALTLSAEAYSKIFTDIVGKTEGVDINLLSDCRINVTVLGDAGQNNLRHYVPVDFTSNANLYYEDAIASTNRLRKTITAFVFPDAHLLNTVSNVQNTLSIHEYYGHLIYGWNDKSNTHYKAFELQMNHPSWLTSTLEYRTNVYNMYKSYRHE